VRVERSERGGTRFTVRVPSVRAEDDALDIER